MTDNQYASFRRIWTFFCLLTLLLVSGSLCARDLADVFRNRKAAFVTIPVAIDTATIFNKQLAEERLPPFSTFKIWNTLIALEEGALSDRHALKPYIANKHPLPDWAIGWKKPHTHKSAFSASAVWYFREMAEQVGAQRMQDWLSRIGYGNADISGGINSAKSQDYWNNSTLQVSAIEQARLLADTLGGRLPFSPFSIAVLHDIAHIESGEEWRIYGKSGSGRWNGQWVGWYLGWIENPSTQQVFALVMLEENYAALKSARLDLSKEALRALQLLPKQEEMEQTTDAIDR